MENDKVEDAFNDASDKYDKYRKQAIPNMELYYNTAIELTQKYDKPKILDLGAGTGILTQLLHEKHPESDITLLDLSVQMLNKAKDKFKKQNFKYIIADYLSYDYNEKYDVVISSLSIHHLTDEKKQELYKKVYSILNDGGIFINADEVYGQSEETEQIFKNKDSSHLNKQDIPEEEKEVLRQRRKLDRPSRLTDTIRWYEDIGFVNVDVYYKYYRYFVVAGEK